ncbi:MAG: hypothetical protein BYD32DRAFT_38972 [Podila humilis]|nr:MAG: hypothetical protein BYD32DRAFT_38972 [Podila humilis]
MKRFWVALPVFYRRTVLTAMGIDGQEKMSCRVYVCNTIGAYPTLHTRILKLHIISPHTRQHSPFSHSPMSTLPRSRCYKSIFVTYEIKPCIQVGHLAIPP